MKKSLFAAGLLLVCPVVSRAEDIKTIDGKEYKNVTVSRVEPDGVVIMASYGIIKIPFEQLPPGLRENASGRLYGAGGPPANNVRVLNMANGQRSLAVVELKFSAAGLRKSQLCRMR